MPDYVKIQGTKEQLLEAVDISGLLISPRTAQQIDATNSWEVNAYASDDAVAELEGRGATITVLVTEEETAAHLASLDGYIGENSNGTGVA